MGKKSFTYYALFPLKVRISGHAFKLRYFLFFPLNIQMDFALKMNAELQIVADNLRN